MNAFIQGLLDRSLFDPVNDFKCRQGKRIRGSLLQCVYEMAGGQGLVPEAVSESIESLHAGSLVIDDVQDESRSRRGRPTLHQQIGIPLAINAGNWIYFQALECLSRSQLPPGMRCRLLEAMIDAARVCHEGQAIDLQARVDRVPVEHWHETISVISLWKTGRLVELAVRMGCIAAEAPEVLLSIMPPLGRRIGVALQMRNDLDELSAVARGGSFADGPHPLRDDDLRNARITWPWVWGLDRIGGRRCRELAMLLNGSADDRSRVARELFEAIERQGNEAIESQIDESMRLMAEHVIDRELLGRMGQILEAIRRPGDVRCIPGPNATPAVIGASFMTLTTPTRPMTSGGMISDGQSESSRPGAWPGKSRRGRAAVIGSGFGGLAAAIRLQGLGFETVCYEALDRPGGRAYVYQDAGFTFDAGPTVITAPHCLEELFGVAGESMADHIELIPVDPMYRLQWPDGARFDYTSDPVRLVEQVRMLSPGDVEGYHRFAEYTRKVFEKGYVQLGAVPFLRFSDMVRCAPDLMRLRADRSVYSTVSRFISDERLRQAFSFHPLLVGGNPLETSAIYTLIHWIERQWGVFFPRGGTGALVSSLVQLFRRLGGELKLSTPVDRIAVCTGPKGRPRHDVHDAQGGKESFDLVVSNADIHHTYARLYRDEQSAVPVRRRLEKMDWSMSLFVMYFGTKRRYPDLAHHTILFGQRYQGLLKEIFHGDALPEDFSLYLHAPTISDPGMAPPGGEAFYVLSPVPHLGRADVAWEETAERYGNAILASLEETLPGLRESIVTLRHFTPIDFRDRLNAYHGSAFSVAPKLTQSAYFRPHNKSETIPNLYIVGSGTHPGAGVPGVVNSAKATVGIIARDFAEVLK